MSMYSIMHIEFYVGLNSMASIGTAAILQSSVCMCSLSTGLLRDYLYSGYPTVLPSVTFSPGSLSSSVFNAIAIGNNAFYPGLRSFTVGFELPDVSGINLRKGRPDKFTVTIVDDDCEFN